MSPWFYAIPIVCILIGIALWPIFAAEKDERWKTHRDQQKALLRHHRMMARDRNEREHVAWWKALGIGR